MGGSGDTGSSLGTDGDADVELGEEFQHFLVSIGH
jgi:hypothetical protein